MQWYYAVGDQRVGPVTEAQFSALVLDGTIRADTLVWKAGMATWLPYATVQSGATSAAAVVAAPVILETVAAAADETEVCAFSGKRYARREMFQQEGKWIANEYRDAYFQQSRGNVVPPGGFRYGGFWIRFCAKVIDWIIICVVSIPIRGVIYSNASFLLGIAIAVGYTWFFIARFQATPGKMALGLKLVKSDGSPLSTSGIIGRYFAEWLSLFTFLVGYVMAGFDEQKRALHDRVCDTRVIYKK